MPAGWENSTLDPIVAEAEVGKIGIPGPDGLLPQPVIHNPRTMAAVKAK
jgi:hypothetical protein